MSVDKWADTFRILAKESGSSSGRWDTSRVEAGRGPMKSVTEPGVHEITVMSCTQLLKTEFINNTFGYLAHIDPSPILLLQPDDDAAKDFAKERIGPLVKATPVLRELMDAGAGRGAEETLLFKPFPGGYLAMAGARSPTNLASRPIRALLCDEVDKYKVTREGDAVTIAGERTASFDLNYLIILACSPTVEDESRIAQSYAESDQRRASIACPDCGHRQFPDFFKHVEWDKRRDAKGNVVENLPRTAAMHCEACGSVWSEGQRLMALRSIRWHQTRPFECCDRRQAPLSEYDIAWRAAAHGVDPVPVVWDWWEDAVEGRYAVYRARCADCGRWAVDNKHAGFQAGKLLSPWQKDRPADIAEKWLKAKGDPSRELAWWNTQMGLTHRPSAGKRIEVAELLERRENWGRQVPDEVAVVTIGVDVQDDRLELEVVGWGRDEESWSLEYEVIEGEMDNPVTQATLDAYLLRSWEKHDGSSLIALATCIDSGGHHTQAVYAFAKARLGRHVWAIKGASERDGARNPVWPTKRPTRRTRAAFRPVLIGGNTARDSIRSRLAIEELPAPGQPMPGFMHFPADRDVGYFQQLLADRLTLKEVGSRLCRIWETPAGRANEAADCRVYAFAALCGLSHFGLQLNKRAARALEERSARMLAPTAAVSASVVAKPREKRSLASRLA